MNCFLEIVNSLKELLVKTLSLNLRNLNLFEDLIFFLLIWKFSTVCFGIKFYKYFISELSIGACDTHLYLLCLTF